MRLPESCVRPLIFLAACAALGACSSGGDIRETLGLNRKAPDEFRVYARPPLTVPPDFNLRAPGTATDAPAAIPADMQARNTVLGSTDSAPLLGKANTVVPIVSAGELPSTADAQFLQNAGAHRAQSTVRSQIQQESETGLVQKDSHYLLNPTSTSEPTVDATKEAQRIKQNKAENKPVTAGDTPVEEQKSKGILGTLGDLF